MTNQVILKGIIHDIRPSHKIGDTEFYQAFVTVDYLQHTDEITIKFKRFSCRYSSGDYIEIVGNLRTFNRKTPNGVKVEVFVFTHFDTPEYVEADNIVELEGRFCSIEPPIQNDTKALRHAILLNKIETLNGTKVLRSFIPCVMFNQNAILNLTTEDFVLVKGRLHSRIYKKVLENGEIEFRTAQEVVIKSIEKKS